MAKRSTYLPVDNLFLKKKKSLNARKQCSATPSGWACSHTQKIKNHLLMKQVTLVREEKDLKTKGLSNMKEILDTSKGDSVL